MWQRPAAFAAFIDGNSGGRRGGEYSSGCKTVSEVLVGGEKSKVSFRINIPSAFPLSALVGSPISITVRIFIGYFDEFWATVVTAPRSSLLPTLFILKIVAHCPARQDKRDWWKWRRTRVHCGIPLKPLNNVMPNTRIRTNTSHALPACAVSCALVSPAFFQNLTLLRRL